MKFQTTLLIFGKVSLALSIPLVCFNLCPLFTFFDINLEKTL